MRGLPRGTTATCWAGMRCASNGWFVGGFHVTRHTPLSAAHTTMTSLVTPAFRPAMSNFVCRSNCTCRLHLLRSAAGVVREKSNAYLNLISVPRASRVAPACLRTLKKEAAQRSCSRHNVKLRGDRRVPAVCVIIMNKTTEKGSCSPHSE